MNSKEQSERDLKDISFFFKKARNDSRWLSADKITALSNFPFFKKLQGPDSLKFLVYANEKIISLKKDKDHLIKEIVEYCANQKNISEYVQLFVFACIFENTTAIKLLKIRENSYDNKKAYNVTSDLFHIFFSILTRYFIEKIERGPIKKVYLFSFDNALNQFDIDLRQFIDLKGVDFEKDEEPEFDFYCYASIPRKFFPNANNKDIELLKKLFEDKFIFE